jgi:hypothetical protein
VVVNSNTFLDSALSHFLVKDLVPSAECKLKDHTPEQSIKVMLLGLPNPLHKDSLVAVPAAVSVVVV